MLVVVQINGKNFSLPIEGCIGERTDRRGIIACSSYELHNLIYFPHAKMPNCPIKQKLKQLGVNHVTFKFVVNGKILGDSIRREAKLNTDKIQLERE